MAIGRTGCASTSHPRHPHDKSRCRHHRQRSRTDTGRAAALLAACLVLQPAPAAAQVEGPGLLPGVQFETGVNYHAVSADFLNDAFVGRYDQPGVRPLVLEQLAGIAAGGATHVRTMLWLVGEPSESWRLSFPLSDAHVRNIQAYARDVAATRRPDGAFLELELTLAWLGCADYTRGAPDTGVGYCSYPWATFLSHARSSIASLVNGVSAITGPDGHRAVRLIYMAPEIMIGARANEDRFLFDLYPFFLERAARAGVQGSLYFLLPSAESEILDADFVDADHPAINGRRSMYWVYRSVRFLLATGLGVPPRLDLSFYPQAASRPTAELVERVMNDAQAVFPGYRIAIVETEYFADEARRQTLGQAFASSYLSRGIPEAVTFWTTPLDGSGFGAPFDVRPYTLRAPDESSQLTVSAEGITWAAAGPSATAAVWLHTGAAPVLLACGRSGRTPRPPVPAAPSMVRLFGTPSCTAGTVRVTGVLLAEASLDAP